MIAPAPDLGPELAARGPADRRCGSPAALDVTGILAVELFETPDGRVLVNELAMRPHNTGHWTQDGAVTSQFENHLRAVLDLPLGSPGARATWTVMVNVLGGPTGPATCTAATRRRWPPTPAAGAPYGKERARAARSATSTPTATSSRTASRERGMPPRGSRASRMTR